jgi:carbamate kinase
VTVDDLRHLSFPAGSMGPKVRAALRFVDATGNRAAIGALPDIEKLVDGAAGTQVLGRARRSPAR